MTALFYLIVGAAILAGAWTGAKFLWTRWAVKKADEDSSHKSYMAEEVNSDNIFN